MHVFRCLEFRLTCKKMFSRSVSTQTCGFTVPKHVVDDKKIAVLALLSRIDVYNPLASISMDAFTRLQKPEGVSIPDIFVRIMYMLINNDIKSNEDLIAELKKSNNDLIHLAMNALGLGGLITSAIFADVNSDELKFLSAFTHALDCFTTCDNIMTAMAGAARIEDRLVSELTAGLTGAAYGSSSIPVDWTTSSRVVELFNLSE